MVDIFDEVDEDLRAERAQRFVRRYGGLVAGAVLAVLVASGGWQAWRWWQAKHDLAAAEAYWAGMSALEQAPAGARTAGKDATAAFERASGGPPGYASLAGLRMAALQADGASRTGAAELWNQIGSDPSNDPLIRDLAQLLWVENQLDVGDPIALEAQIKPLEASDNPWRALALEAAGLLDVRQAKFDAAKQAFRGLSQDMTAPEAVRERAHGLLNQLGG